MITHHPHPPPETPGTQSTGSGGTSQKDENPHSNAQSGTQGATALRVKERAWPHENSDVKPDPRIKWGRLPNGFRYAILPNFTPEHRVSLRLQIDTGSLHDPEGKLGLAKFVQRSTFLGTTRFPDGGILEYLDKLGMRTGAVRPAVTSYLDTVYRLQLPTNDLRTMKVALALLSEFTRDAIFQVQKIEEERELILSEISSRGTIESRTQEANLQLEYPNSALVDRPPGGTRGTISALTVPDLKSFYDLHYRPDRMTLYVVGDIDPDSADQLVTANFKDLVPRVSKDVDEAEGVVLPSGRDTVAALHTEPRAAFTTIAISTNRVSQRRVDNTELRRDELARSMGNGMLSRRFDYAVSQGKAPIVKGQSGVQGVLNVANKFSVNAITEPEKWAESLAFSEQKLRRAIQFGFSEDEFSEARRRFLEFYQDLADRASLRNSSVLGDLLLSKVGSGLVFTHPEDDFGFVKKTLISMTREECHEQLKQEWDNSDISIFVAGNIGFENGKLVRDAEEISPADKRGQIIAIKDGQAGRTSVSAPAPEPRDPEEAVAAAQLILEAYAKSRSVKIDKSDQSYTPRGFAYENSGTPGKLVSRNFVKDLNITQVVFGNNVRVNFKPTTFESDSISVLASFGGGRLDVVPGKPGLEIFTSSVFTEGGLGKHSAAELEETLAGRKVSADFIISDDSFLIRGYTRPKDIKTQLQLLCAYLNDPGFRPEGADLLRKSADITYGNIDRLASGIIQAKVEPYLRGSDPRFAFPTKEELLALTMEDAREWLMEPLQKGYLEVGIVGDFNLEQALVAATGTLGALPKRENIKPDYEKERELTFPSDVKVREFNFVGGSTARAMLMAFWKTVDLSDPAMVRRLDLLAGILSDRLRRRIRADMQETYSFQSANISSDTFTNYGYILAQSNVMPQHVENISAILKEVTSEIYNQGVTEQEVASEKAPALDLIRKQMRTNEYWLDTVVANCQELPGRLDWTRSAYQDCYAITWQEINKLAKDYLSPWKVLQIKVVPEKTK